jgi:hypothetical protein
MPETPFNIADSVSNLDPGAGAPERSAPWQHYTASTR